MQYLECECECDVDVNYSVWVPKMSTVALGTNTLLNILK